jgi:hypothetical protein
MLASKYPSYCKECMKLEKEKKKEEKRVATQK